MTNTTLVKQIRTFEVYSIMQGILLVFMAEWFRYGPPVIQMVVPPDAASIQLEYKILTIGLLVVIVTVLLTMIHLKTKIQRQIIDAAGAKGAP
jgi:hypothetical protein